MLACGLRTSLHVADAPFGMENELCMVRSFLEAYDWHFCSLKCKRDEADAEFFVELHLLIQRDTIMPTLKLIHNMVHISYTPGSGCSLSIS